MSSRVAFAWKPSRANAARAAKRRPTLSPQFNLYGLASILVVILYLFLSPSLGFVDLPKFVVNLPRSSHALPQPGALREDAIEIGVTRDGHYFFDKREIESREIPAHIWESIRGGSEIKVFLWADARAATSDFNTAIEQIHRAGIRDVVIVTNNRAN